VRTNQEFRTSIGFETKSVQYSTFKADSQKAEKSANIQYNKGTPRHITNMQINESMNKKEIHKQTEGGKLSVQNLEEWLDIVPCNHPGTQDERGTCPSEISQAGGLKRPAPVTLALLQFLLGDAPGGLHVGLHKRMNFSVERRNRKNDSRADSEMMTEVSMVDDAMRIGQTANRDDYVLTEFQSRLIVQSVAVFEMTLSWNWREINSQVLGQNMTIKSTAIVQP
jgi:hypothetical protein